MKIKKILIIALIIMLSLTITGCNGKDSKNNEEQNVESQKEIVDDNYIEGYDNDDEDYLEGYADAEDGEQEIE